MASSPPEVHCISRQWWYHRRLSQCWWPLLVDRMRQNWVSLYRPEKWDVTRTLSATGFEVDRNGGMNFWKVVKQTDDWHPCDLCDCLHLYTEFDHGHDLPVRFHGH